MNQLAGASPPRNGEVGLQTVRGHLQIACPDSALKFRFVVTGHTRDRAAIGFPSSIFPSGPHQPSNPPVSLKVDSIHSPPDRPKSVTVWSCASSVVNPER